VKTLVSLFVKTWDSLDTTQREKILDQVTPNQLVKSVVMSLSATRQRVLNPEDDYPPASEEDLDEDIIDAEFIESDLKDGFGA
jgi:hypothetical protein